MINLIDIILLALGAYFFLLGFSRGLLRSLFGPVALIAGSVIAYVYYQQTHNAFIATAIALFAPMGISLLLRVVLGGWLASLNPLAQPSALSRLSGAAVTVAWGWTFVVLSMILIEVFPSISKPVTDLQTLVHQSKVAQLTVLPFKSLLIPPPTKEDSTKPVKVEELAQDPRIAALANDPEVKLAAEKHDYVTLLKHPKVMALTQEMMHDPVLRKKMMATFQELQKQKTTVKP